MKNRFLFGLLALLGFSGCSSLDSDMAMPSPEYGTPYIEFEAKGKVTDRQNNPLNNIRVVFKPFEKDNFYNDTTYTNSAGNYGFKITSDYIYPNTSVWLIAEDIDGESNGGAFATQTERVELVKADFTGGDDWYYGKAEKTVDFKLAKETRDEE